MNKFKELLSNTGLFALSNLSSKVFVFLLVPLYTNILTTEEYGTADLLQTTVTLLLPILTLGLTEAVLRFTITKNYAKEQVLSFPLKVTFIGFGIFLCVTPLVVGLRLFEQLSTVIWLLPFMFLFSALRGIFNQYCKGINKLVLFSVESVINAISMIAFSALALLVFRWGVWGYLFAILLSNFLSCCIYLLFGGFLKDIHILMKTDKQLLNEMIRYSLPLIPNSLLWWVTNSSDRYILAAMSGVAVTGIYTVAYKIPSIFSSVSGIFMQAWQMSAMKEYDGEKEEAFFRKVYNLYLAFTVLFASVLFIFIKPIASIVFGNEFYNAWKFVPILMVAAAISNLQSFLGAIYGASKKTATVFYTTMAGALLNIVLNFALIPQWNAYGAAIATLISYLVVFIYRAIDTKKYVNVHALDKRIIIRLGILLFQMAYMTADLPLSTVVSAACFVILIFIERKTLFLIIDVCKNFLSGRIIKKE